MRVLKGWIKRLWRRIFVSVISEGALPQRIADMRLWRPIFTQADGRLGHIFNLGHGILPETPVENIRLLADFVHNQAVRDTTAAPPQ